MARRTTHPTNHTPPPTSPNHTSKQKQTRPITQVPAEYQPRALTWGIIGAVAMRGAMIFLGVAAIQRFRWVVLLFAGILLGSAFKLLFGGEEEGDLSDNFMLKVAGKMVNAVDQYDGDRFFTMVRRDGWVGACWCVVNQTGADVFCLIPTPTTPPQIPPPHHRAEERQALRHAALHVPPLHRALRLRLRR